MKSKLTHSANGSTVFEKSDEKAEVRENCGINSCIMKDDLTKAIDGFKSQNRWFMGIFGGAMIILLVGYGAIGTNT